jgi:adenosylcobinamide-phosphate synthase
MAFKTASTLDSMIGHTSDRYLYFGRAAARLDDLANYLPARLTALSISVATLTRGPARSYTALRLWLRDGDRHKSPNAGQPEAAIAGALSVQLGGASTYGGEVVASPVLGGEYPRPGTRQVGQAIQLTIVVSLLAWAAALALMRGHHRLDKKPTQDACA